MTRALGGAWVGTDVLAIGAHPDDVELAFGGLLVRAARRGLSVVIVDATAGEAGRRGDAARRRREAHTAATLLATELSDAADAKHARLPSRSAVRSSLGDPPRILRRTDRLPDGALEHHPGGAAWVLALLDEHRPRVLLGHAPFDAHPDHRALAAWMLDACATLTRQQRPLLVWGAPTFPPTFPPAQPPRADAAPAPDALVALVPSELAAKRRLVACHRSQLERADARDVGAHLPGGMDILARADALAAHFGRGTAHGAAEPLWAASAADRASLADWPLLAPPPRI